MKTISKCPIKNIVTPPLLPPAELKYWLGWQFPWMINCLHCWSLGRAATPFAHPVLHSLAVPIITIIWIIIFFVILHICTIYYSLLCPSFLCVVCQCEYYLHKFLLLFIFNSQRLYFQSYSFLLIDKQNIDIICLTQKTKTVEELEERKTNEWINKSVKKLPK